MTPLALLEIAAGMDHLAAIRDFVRETARRFGADEVATDDLVLAVNEMVTNTLMHGYQDKHGTVRMEIEDQGECIAVHLYDQAPPFDFDGVQPPDLSLPLEQRAPGGLGIYLTRQLMDQVTYRVTGQNENEIILVRAKSSS